MKRFGEVREDWGTGQRCDSLKLAGTFDGILQNKVVDDVNWDNDNNEERSRVSNNDHCLESKNFVFYTKTRCTCNILIAEMTRNRKELLNRRSTTSISFANLLMILPIGVTSK